jgi:hypothetical protein
MAIEGCHRLTAAAELGIAPRLTVLQPEELVDVDTLDSDFELGATYTAGEIARGYRSHHNRIMTINPDGTLTIVSSAVEEEP